MNLKPPQRTHALQDFPGSWQRSSGLPVGRDRNGDGLGAVLALVGQTTKPVVQFLNREQRLCKLSQTQYLMLGRKTSHRCSVFLCIALECFFFPPQYSYIYKLKATTRGGSSFSGEYLVQTPPLTPEDIQPPYNITALGPDSVFIAWTPPGKEIECVSVCVCETFERKLIGNKIGYVNSVNPKETVCFLENINKIMQTTVLRV